MSFSPNFLQPHKFAHTYFVTLHKENNDCKRALAKKNNNKSSCSDQTLRLSFPARGFFIFYLKHQNLSCKTKYRKGLASLRTGTEVCTTACKNIQKHPPFPAKGEEVVFQNDLSSVKNPNGNLSILLHLKHSFTFLAVTTQSVPPQWLQCTGL